MSVPARISALLVALAALLLFAGSAHAHPLSFEGAPAFVETTGPSDHGAVVITVHGGAWISVGPEAAATQRPEASTWAERGWTAVNVSYRAGRRALGDVLWFYDRVRRHVGRRTPVCLSGASAGGHLALMTAVRRAGVTCVVARGAPTNLTTIGRQRAWGADGAQAAGPAMTRRWAIQAFGRRGLRAMSPALHGGRIRARVLYAIGDRDPYVPWDQALELASAMPRADVFRLSWGSQGWVHTSVSPAAVRRFRRAERTFATGARRARARRAQSSS